MQFGSGFQYYNIEVVFKTFIYLFKKEIPKQLRFRKNKTIIIILLDELVSMDEKRNFQ